MALHIAVALAKPVVALFGPTSAAEIELYGQGEKIQPPGLDCLVCYLSRCDKSPYCQELIDPERVASAVEGQLARRA
jgi:ADP-heptose:LPS heptosyltransferase